jgi:hypothetical protein
VSRPKVVGVNILLAQFCQPFRLRCIDVRLGKIIYISIYKQLLMYPQSVMLIRIRTFLAGSEFFVPDPAIHNYLYIKQKIGPFLQFLSKIVYFC